MNILDAIADTKVFASHFRGATWAVWKVFLAALFALPMTAEQFEIFKAHTGRQAAPTTPFLEAWLVCGRRAGKSFMLGSSLCFWRVSKIGAAI